MTSGGTAARVRRLLAEPLFVFSCIAAASFAVYARRGPAAPERVELGARDLDAIDRATRVSLGREPTEAERLAARALRVDDELALREALGLGLCASDPVVRRRLVQTMDALAETRADPSEPDDAELSAYLAAHADELTGEPEVDLEHVFFTRGPDAVAHARDASAELTRGADPREVGDAFLAGRSFRAQRRSDVARVLGDAIARAAFEGTVGSWSEPLTSSLGVHLVRVTRRSEAKAPALGALRGELRERVLEARRAAAREAARVERRTRFDVVIGP